MRDLWCGTQNEDGFFKIFGIYVKEHKYLDEASPISYSPNIKKITYQVIGITHSQYEFVLGEYETKTRAVEVVREIREQMNSNVDNRTLFYDISKKNK